MLKKANRLKRLISTYNTLTCAGYSQRAALVAIIRSFGLSADEVVQIRKLVVH